MIDSFDHVVFPENVSFGSTASILFQTDVLNMDSGFEKRNTRWRYARRHYNLSVGPARYEEIHQICQFFEARRGRLNGFLFRDWMDDNTGHKAPSWNDESLLPRDESRQIFPLYKSYGSVKRRIFKPREEGFVLAQDGQQLTLNRDYSIDLEHGEVRLTRPLPDGRHLTAGFYFYVPVRFDTDRLDQQLISFETVKIASLPLMELIF